MQTWIMRAFPKRSKRVTCHKNWGNVGIGNSRGSEQGASGNTDADAGRCRW